MTNTLTEASLTSVAARFADTSPSEFSGKIQDLFTVLGRMRDEIQKSVEEGLIPPTTGCGILACASAQLFGYAEYTGIVNPSPLSAAMWTEHGNGKGTTG
jgi:hypothetical protein